MSNNRSSRHYNYWLMHEVAAHAKWLSGDSEFGRRLMLNGYNLSGHDLSGMDLRNASLKHANLSGADLRNTDLTGADLTGSYALPAPKTTGAKLPSPILDLSGTKVGYKKVWGADRYTPLVIELRFPAEAKLVSTLVGRKCRTSEAEAYVY
jgi:hypothetical protein